MAVPFTVGASVHELGTFNDRRDEVARVRRAIRERERLLVYGERRMGKTSILLRAADRERAEHDATVLWLDLWSLTSVADMLRAVLGAVPMRWAPLQRFQALLAGADVRPMLTGDPSTGQGGLSLGWSTRELTDDRARSLLRATLQALDEVAREHAHPITLVIDEFQEIESITAQGGGFLRSIVQETGRLGYVLAGSMLSLVDTLTAPRGPFYSIERLDVGPIAADLLAPWVEERMRDHGLDVPAGLGRTILERAGPSTEARIKLARETFLLGQDGGNADEDTVVRAFGSLVASMTSAYEAIWAKTPQTQRRALQILANSEPQPTSSHTLDAYGLGSSAAFVRATDALRTQGLVMIHEPTSIGDPFFAAWIRERTSPPVAPAS